jgi:hypothetical protein
MMRDDDLSQALASIGYRKQEPLVFRLEQNFREVEHFLYFLVRPEKDLVAARFGFRVPDAERFSVAMFSRYARDDFSSDKMLSQHSCSMRYSFGRFYSMLRPGYWSLNNEDDWVAPILADIETYLIPFASRLSERKDMFELLAADHEPCPWFANNAALRVVQVLFLGVRLRKPRSMLQTIVNSRQQEIQRDLAAEERGASVEEFVRTIFEEAGGN